MDIPELDEWYREYDRIEYLARKIKAVRNSLLYDDWALNVFLIDAHHE